MNISVIGINHHTAPVEVREKFALPGDLGSRLLCALRTEGPFEEALVLDTCNRTEVYFVPRGQQDSLHHLLDHIGRLKGVSASADGSAFYQHDGESAVTHLFRVAAALDSQIVGEHQILGQVKNAYRVALEQRTGKFLLNKLLHRAFRVGKRVQTETDLGRGSTGAAQAAVDLARQIFSDLRGKTALLAGAGQTGELAARGLIRLGVGKLIVANRTLSRAQVLADSLAADPAPNEGWPVGDVDDKEWTEPEQIRCPAVLRILGRSPKARGGCPSRAPAASTIEAVTLEDIPRVMADVELVICSTGSPDPILTRHGVGEIVRSSKHHFFIIDIAVPRDVDPELGDLPNVFLYNMNDLDRVVAQNIERRRQEIPRAEGIVDDEVRQFVKWHDSLEVASTIKLLQRRFGMLQQAEIERYGKRFSSDDGEQLPRFTKSLCNKILHQPIAFLRALSEEGSAGDRLAAADVIRQMFDLDSLEDQA